MLVSAWCCVSPAPNRCVCDPFGGSRIEAADQWLIRPVEPARGSYTTQPCSIGGWVNSKMEHLYGVQWRHDSLGLLCSRYGSRWIRVEPRLGRITEWRLVRLMLHGV